MKKHRLRATILISMDKIVDVESDELPAEMMKMKVIMGKAPLAFIEAAPMMKFEVEVMPLVEH